MTIARIAKNLFIINKLSQAEGFVGRMEMIKLD